MSGRARGFVAAEWAPCQCCGRVRMINTARPAPLCRDCRTPDMSTNHRHPCPDCARLITTGGMTRHRGSKGCTT